MAFNPFHSFRRHQKVIFAGLTILCMGIFVLSSGMGGGDFFSQLGQWTLRRGHKDAVATLYGRDVDRSTLQQVQHRREWANRYITMLTSMARNQIVNNVVLQRDRVDPALKQIIEQFQQLLAQQNQPAQFEAGLARLQGQIGMALPALEQSTAANKKDQLKLANDLGFLFGHFRNMIGRGNDTYFGGNPRSTEDTLDFMIWLKKADDLGIRIDEQDFEEHLRRELMGQTFGKEDWDIVNRQFNTRGPDGIDPDSLREALSDEFRVRTAKVTLAGIAPVFLTHTAPPVLAPPIEKFDWYKDAKTKVKVGLIEVPVARFLDRVASQPTEVELRTLYDQYKNVEPSPESETPGFRTPRMVKIEWMLIPEHHAFYLEQAEKLGPVFAALRSFGVVPAAGGNILPATTLGLNLIFADKMQRYENEAPTWRDPGAFGIRSGIHDSTVLGAASGDAPKPTVEPHALAKNVATLVGGLLGGHATGAPVVSAPLILEGRLLHRELVARALIGAAIILNGNVGPAAPLTIDVATLLLTPRSLTADQLRPILTERIRDDLARTLKQSDMEAFIAELNKRGADKDSGNATVFINEFALARRLTRGGMAEPRDVHSLAADPALVDVRAAFDRFANFVPPAGPDPVGEKFAFYLAFMPEAQRGEKPRTFSPQEFFGTQGTYLAWRSVDNESKLQKFDEAKAEVERAWRMGKARELAKQEAAELAKKAKGADEQKLRDLAAAFGTPLIELPPMARFNRNQSFMAGRTGYQAPEVPRTLVKYPGTMASELVDLRKQDVGATTVVADQPKNHFYAAVMTEKLVPSMSEFRIAFMDSMAPEMSRDTLFDFMRAELRNEFITDLLTTLRKQAKLEILKTDKPAEGERAE